MQLVVDANVLFSALITLNGKTADLLFSSKLTFIAPEFIETELEKYLTLIVEKSGQNLIEVESSLRLLLEKISIIPSFEYKQFLKVAEDISPDPHDIEYFAVALAFNCPLWSNDKLLKKQSSVKVFSTSELLQFLS